MLPAYIANRTLPSAHAFRCTGACLGGPCSQTFSFRAGGFRIPGPALVFRGHTPGASRRLWTSRWYGLHHVPGEGTKGLAAHPWRSAVRFLLHLGVGEAKYPSVHPCWSDARRVLETRRVSLQCAEGAPRELMPSPSAEPLRPTGAVSSRRACAT